MVWSTIVIVLVVAVFLFTFVIPLAKRKVQAEGFQYSTDPAITAELAAYAGERTRMTDESNRIYNNLGSSLDPTLPTFAMASPDAAKINDPNLTDNQYMALFDSVTNKVNKKVSSALQTPDVRPSTTSVTNMSITPIKVSEQLPPSNNLLLAARHCENTLKGRRSCSLLKDPANSLCGVCLDAGTQFDGSNPGSLIGGLLSLQRDRAAAEDAAGNGIPIYTPTLGKCPPGMFFVDVDACTKAANQLNCTEIGQSGGFTGGKTHEGNTLNTISCAQAPVVGSDVFVYQPKTSNKYDIVLRVLSPFGTGITQVVVTHIASGRTFKADNGGNPGQEFTVSIPGVTEADDMDVMVAQEAPHRPKGQTEVFNVYERILFGNNYRPKTYTSVEGAALCNRVGATIASSNQVANEVQNGIQSRVCSVVVDEEDTGYFATQSVLPDQNTINVSGGITGAWERANDTETARSDRLSVESPASNSIPLTNGSANPASGFCKGGTDSINYDSAFTNWAAKNFNGAMSIDHKWGPNMGVWCYGFKPASQNLLTKDPIQTVFANWFDSYGNKTQPAQGASKYSKFSVPGTVDPPGTSERAVVMQWEMKGSNNRTVPFQQTIHKVNSYPVDSVIRLLGPFQKSGSIAGPAWSSNSSMLKTLFWFWSNMPKSQTVVFSAKVPGYLNDPYYRDDLRIAPLGPLITNSSTAKLLKTSECSAAGQTPGAYSTACLLELFRGSGGDPSRGTFATTGGGLAQLNKLGDVSAISDYLSSQYKAATSGKDENGQALSQDLTVRMDAMNEAAVKMFGFKIINPCEMIVDNADGSVGLVAMPMTQVTPECLQYLWLNNNSDQDRPGFSGNDSLFSRTYTSIADRFSGLRNTESTAKYRKQYPFQACQLTGKGTPIKGGKPDVNVIEKLMGLPTLKDVQDYINGIHKMANYPKGPQNADAQASAVEQCYGYTQTKNNTKGYGCGQINISGRFTRNVSGDTTYFTIIQSSAISVTSPMPIKYFAVAGGAGGGAKNGGGAGGLQTNTDSYKFSTQKGPDVTLAPNTKYTLMIGDGGQIHENGGDTKFTGDDVEINAIGGAAGGATSQYCPADSGGCGGGGCPSTGVQGGSSSGPNGSVVANAAGGIGGNVSSYWVGGPGIMFNGVEYGTAAQNVAESYDGRANTGEGGANDGVGGSGVFIMAIKTELLI